MPGVFPNQEWLDGFINKLNTDEKYAQVAATWEADMNFIIEPSGPVTETVAIYLDLWHGKCRDAYFVTSPEQHREAMFTLSAPYDNMLKVVKGGMDPMQAMLTRKLNVKGNMAYMMRNVPTVLAFVRCLRESTDEVL